MILLCPRPGLGGGGGGKGGGAFSMLTSAARFNASIQDAAVCQNGAPATANNSRRPTAPPSLFIMFKLAWYRRLLHLRLNSMHLDVTVDRYVSMLRWRNGEHEGSLTSRLSSAAGIQEPFSRTTTRWPSLASTAAAGAPPAPEPTTTTSHLTTKSAPSPAKHLWHPDQRLSSAKGCSLISTSEGLGR